MATIKGKWVFNENPLSGLESNTVINQTVSFSSNNQSYSSMEASREGGVYLLYYGNTLVFDADELMWDTVSRECKNVDFGTSEQTVSDTFLTWLTSNATPEAEPTPTDAVTITYNNTVIASLKAGQSAILHCMGDNVKMLTDIVITVPAGMGDVQMISFTIDGDHYEAEDGMTWEEWVDSEYNTAGYKASEHYVTYDLQNYFVTDVSPNDVIEGDRAYTLTAFDIGGGSN